SLHDALPIYDVGVLEGLGVREFDRTARLANPRLSERHRQITGPAGAEIEAPGRKIADLELPEAVGARHPPFGDRFAAQAQLHAPQRAPFGVRDLPADDASAFLLDCRRVARGRADPYCLCLALRLALGAAATGCLRLRRQGD